MKIKLNTHICLPLFILSLLYACLKETNTPIDDRKILFNENWNFHLVDTLKNDSAKYEPRNLNLPHDWSIEGKFDEKHPATYNGGALPGGTGIYTKTFVLDDEDRDKNFYIHFDGVYMNSKVWINDHYLGNRPNGYIGFSYNLTPHLLFNGKENVIKVKVDNSDQPNSRWYSGSGIYRNVWLIKTDKLHIDIWGTFVTTPVISNDSTIVKVETSLVNDYKTVQAATIKAIVTFNNEYVTEKANHITLEPNENFTFSEALKIENPQLWSLNTPHLYTLLSEVYINNELVDIYETEFGIRSFTFDSEKGFSLNGEQLKIKGVCNHHDLGALGSAVNKRAIERQLEILKGMGVNGIRTAHNPPAPELLELCDKMGFVVMDEAFDMWKKGKTKYDYSLYWDEWYEKDLTDFIKRDRNHPSVIIWSVGNEILEQWDSTGIDMVKDLVNKVKLLDTTRPITTGNNPPSPTNNLNRSNVLDLVGYNYAHHTYENHKETFPNQPFIATETSSALATRGYYDQKSDSLKKWPVRWDLLFTGGNPGNTVSAYDQVSTPWGSTHEETWKIIKKHDNLSGMFIWTGFDYLGEPTPYVWPSRSSYFGVIDLAGFPKDTYYMYQSEWTDKPVLHVFPHWNWEEGREVDIWAYYSQADEVELFLNEESLGSKSKTDDELHVMWRIPFKPGILRAVSRKDGKEVLVKEIKTADKASSIKLEADRKTIQPNNDLSFVTVTVHDEHGTLVPNASDNIKFEIEGPGDIAGVDNGDPTSHESFKAHERKAFNGKCLVIVKTKGEPGTITLKASSDNLKESTITINVNK